MVLIEGVGDEVTCSLAVLVLIVILTLAWLSTGVQPFNYHVWLVQLQTATASQPPFVQVLPQEDEAEEDTSHIEHTLMHNDDAAVDNDDDDVVVAQLETIGTAARNSNVQPVSTTSSSLSADDTSAHMLDGDTRIKLKFLDDTHKSVSTWLSQTVGDFKRKYFTPALHDGQVVRLIYQGQLLRDDSRSLASYGLHDNSIVHCHTSRTPYDQQVSSQNRAAESPSPHSAAAAAGHLHNNDSTGVVFNIGDHLEAIFAIKFVLLWSAYVFYPHYFDMTSLISLTICTVVFVMFAYCSRQRVVTNTDPSSTSN